MKIDKDNQLGSTAASASSPGGKDTWIPDRHLVQAIGNALQADNPWSHRPITDAMMHSMYCAIAITDEENARLTRQFESYMKERLERIRNCSAFKKRTLVMEDLLQTCPPECFPYDPTWDHYAICYPHSTVQGERAVEEDDNTDYGERMFKKRTGSRIEGIVPGSPSECFPYEPMRDPVVVASGETYDGANINASSQRLVSPMRAVPRNMGGDESGFMTRGEKNECDILLREIAQGNVCREATRELREMTKKAPYRAYLGYWKTGAIPLLVSLLSSSDSQTQENAVTVLHNLSLCDENRTAIVALGAIPSIVQVLRNGGTMEARGNAAATLFRLAKVDENKQKITASGAIPALLDLLRDGNPIAKKDSLAVLGILCLDHENRIPCVREGMIPLLMKLLSNHSECLDGSLELLAMVAARQEGVEKVGNAGAVPYLMDVIKDGCSSPRSKANAVAILHAICSYDRSHLKEFRDYRNGYIIALTDLSKSGTTKVQRKASAFLDMIMKQEQISIKLAKEEEEDKRLNFI